ncbi:MAG: Unknown protein [uncultured Sulfurovum sp.]|uniref:Uncharacterized protein n=1 Tax=uncultured Sulfurovum sp. TaxID=269237 RepID=A0A6S6UCC6_9BACT|nr:MAG: Unknown protein [uncultured Sulfurovum sp.]
MDKNNTRLFIHKNMEHVSLEQNVEIILTPQFYTFIHEELDIKFSYQAKQIAGALFDDYLDASSQHQYYVTKCENSWCFYAYDIEEIEAFLESVGIAKHRVSKIYFAQALHTELEEPIQLSEKNILQTIEGVVTVIPTRLMESNVYFKTLDLSDIKLNNGVSLGASHSSLISLKSTVILSSLCLILGVIFIIEGNRISTSISGLNEQLVELLDENPSYGTSLVRNSILEKYQPIDNNERAKRQSIKEISKLLSANSQLTTLKIEKTTIKATIKTSNATIVKQVIQNANAKRFKSSKNGLNVQVEKKL